MWNSQKNIPIPTNSSLLKQQSYMQEKQESINHKKGHWMKKYCFWDKNLIISHTQHRKPSIPIPFQPKGKKWEHLKQETKKNRKKMKTIKSQSLKKLFWSRRITWSFLPDLMLVSSGWEGLAHLNSAFTIACHRCITSPLGSWLVWFWGFLSTSFYLKKTYPTRQPGGSKLYH